MRLYRTIEWYFFHEYNFTFKLSILQFIFRLEYVCENKLHQNVENNFTFCA